MKRTDRGIILMTSVFLCLPFAASAEETLESIFAQVQASNPRIVAARARLNQTEELLPLARANWWQPNISVHANEGRQHINQVTDAPPQNVREQITDRKVGVLATLPLYRGGQTSAEISAAENEIQAARADLIANTQSVLTAAAIAYADIALISARLMIMDEWLLDVSRLKERVESMLAAQRATVSGVAEAEERYASILGKRASLQASLRTAQYQLVKISGKTIKHAVLPETLPWVLPAERDAALQLAARQNPALLAATFRERGAENLVDKAKGTLLPEVSLYTSYDRELSGARFTSSQDFTQHNKLDTIAYGIQFTMPLYDGALSPGVRRARMQVAERMADVDQMRDQARMQTENAWNQLSVAKERIRVDTQWVSAAENAFVGAQREFVRRMRTTQDVMTARTHLFTAKEALLQSKHDQFIAAIDLLGSIGALSFEGDAQQLPRVGQ